MNINLREPSTKRGIVMLVTGGIVLYQVVFGAGAADVDALVARVEWWLGIGITIVGMLGLLPDRDSEKRTRESDQFNQNDQLPPIDLVAKSEVVIKKDEQQDVVYVSRSAPSFQKYVDPSDDGVLFSDSKDRDSQDVVERMDVPPEHPHSSGWNG